MARDLDHGKTIPVEGGPMDGSEVEDSLGAEPVLYWADHRYELNLITRRYIYVGVIWVNGPAAELKAIESLTLQPFVAPFDYKLRLFEYCAANGKSEAELCELARGSFDLELSAEPEERLEFFVNLQTDYANWLALTPKERARVSMQELAELRHHPSRDVAPVAHQSQVLTGAFPPTKSAPPPPSGREAFSYRHPLVAFLICLVIGLVTARLIDSRWPEILSPAPHDSYYRTHAFHPNPYWLSFSFVAFFLGGWLFYLWRGIIKLFASEPPE